MAKPAKPKVSAPVIWLGVIAVGVVIYFFTQPADTPAPKKATTVIGSRAYGSGSSASDNGITNEDHTARFAQYVSKKRDAFMPRILSSKDIHPLGKGRGAWVLTGISEIDGQLSALIENSTMGLSQFLKVGDVWNGLHVTNVTSDMVTFLNATGQKTDLMFPSADGAKAAAVGGDAAAFEDTTDTATPTPAAPPVIIINSQAPAAPAANPNGGGFDGGGGFPGGGGGGFPGGGGGGFPGGGFPGGGFPGAVPGATNLSRLPRVSVASKHAVPAESVNRR